jgi:DNA-binding NtrC family response regulator
MSNWGVCRKGLRINHIIEVVTVAKRVLLVDDEPGILKVLSIQLKLKGYGVISTNSGAEAIEMVRTQGPDAVLLDILMPGVTGLDVLDSIREFSQVPVIVFTANPKMAEMAMKMGAVDSVSKPFNADQLAEKIKNVLDGKRGH